MTQAQAVQWLQTKLSHFLDFDGQFGSQCFDSFNYYYQYITGRHPYSDGYGVPSAHQIWNVPTNLFTKIPDSPSLAPQPGDILIYNRTWGAGHGHVEMVESTSAFGCSIIGTNLYGNPSAGVTRLFRTWAQMRGLIGVLRFNGFSASQPTKGDEAMPIRNDEFIKNMYRFVGGREPSPEEINAHRAGTPESLLNGFIGGNDLEVVRQRKTIAELQGIVTSLSSRPTKEELLKVVADAGSAIERATQAERALAEQLAKPPEVVIEKEVIIEHIPVPLTWKTVAPWIAEQFNRLIRRKS